MGYLDPPDDLEPPDWYAMIEEALEDPHIPEGVSTAIRKTLDDWCQHPPDYPEDYAPHEPQENTCRACGKPTNCVYCSAECCPPCAHGNTGDCDACNHLSDLAFDAARERR